MAATHIRRWTLSDLTSTWHTSAIMPGHQEETTVVIDWLTVTIGSSAGGDSGLILTDTADAGGSASATIIYDINTNIAAGTTDTLHFTFPGGFPLSKPIANTAPLRDILTNIPCVLTDLVWESSGALTSCTIRAGFHMERSTNRK